MSHLNPSHEHSNEYPEDKVTDYKKKKTVLAKMAHITNKTGHLKKAMKELGGRFTK